MTTENPFRVPTDVPCGGFQHCEEGCKPRMHPARYRQLMEGHDELAAYEIQQGWHFCEWHDQMLIVAQSTPLCSCPTPAEIRAYLEEKQAAEKKAMELGIVAKYAPDAPVLKGESYIIKHDDGIISGVIYGD